MKFNSHNLRKILLTFFVLALSQFLHAQIKGLIIDKNSRLPIAFASVIYESKSLQKGVISDIHGKFEIKEFDVNSITISCLGYKQQTVLTSNLSKPLKVIIDLDLSSHELQEVIVTPTDNPAHRIIKEVLANKDSNNFKNYDKYSYQCYVKTIIDLKLSSDANGKDSLLIRLLEKKNKRAGFLSEHVINVSKQGNKLENKIIAHKTSGFEDPLLIQAFASTFHNSISFYNNSVSLFELPISADKSISEYVSPLSNGCLSIYTYLLQDTIVNFNDSIFVIDFYPRKGKNFNGLKGKLYINTNGYAINNIVVEPFDKGLIGFKFRQDYELINSKWFPVNLYEEIGLVNQKVAGDINAYPVYLITSKIDSISYNNSFNRKNSAEKVFLDLSTINNSESIINAIRPDLLSVRELNTIHFMDSVGKKHKFDYKLNLITKLADGKIPLGYLDVDLYQLYNYNKFEKTRLGIGLNTNEKVSSYFSLGGFFGYGFNDKKYKYGGNVVFDLNKKNNIKLKILYQDNLKEAGFDLTEDYSHLSLSEYLRSFIGYRFDRYIEKKVEFSFRTFRFLNVSTSFSLKKYRPTYNYSYNGSVMSDYQADEFQINLTYAYGLDIATFGNQQVINHKGNPIIDFTYKRGLNLFDNNSFQYNKFETTLDFMAYNGRIGQSNIRFATGYIDKSLPYGLLFTGEGSNDKDLPLVINNSFQTMSPYEFLSDKYVNLFYSHNFGSLLFSTKKFNPQFIVIQNSGWGNLNNSSIHDIDFKTKEKIYLESGLIINNVIKLNYLNMFYFGFGIGGFYRYGYYDFDNYQDNIALKLSMSISLK